MRKTLTLAAALAAGASLSGCTTTGGPRPIDVTRFHLGAPIAGGTVSIEPLSSSATISPEYRTYADAVATQLGTLGFAPTSGGGETDYIAGVSFVRTSLGMVEKRPPVTIGLGTGGGSYGRHSGVGVGVGGSFGIGGGRAEVIGSELSVQLRRRSDSNVVWEGRAVTQSLSGSEGAQPGATAQRLAAAIFKGFPGESGITITVK